MRRQHVAVDIEPVVPSKVARVYFMKTFNYDDAGDDVVSQLRSVILVCKREQVHEGTKVWRFLVGLQDFVLLNSSMTNQYGFRLPSGSSSTFG